MKQQKGFTLIELVVVIVILGVLAAVALPRFMNATEDAHTAAVQGTGGALAAGVALVRSQWELNRVKGVNSQDPDSNPNTNVTGFGADDLDVNDSGWPVATDGASLATAPTAEQCRQVWVAVMQGSAPSVALAVAGPATERDYDVSVSGGSCTYAYRLDGRTPSSRTIVYNTATGAVTTAAN